MKRIAVGHLVVVGMLLATCRPAVGAVFHLKTGGRVRGELVNRDESPRKRYVINTGGGRITVKREQIERIVSLAERTGLLPMAIDVEPTALLRCYGSQFRRDNDQQRRLMFVNVGAANTVVVIARGSDAMFVKYVDVGGRHLDEVMAQRLKMSLADATALRRHNGDRRADGRDPEIEQSIAESIRPVLDRLANELSMCLRYYSVTFRGQPLSQLVLGGGEAHQPIADWLSARLNLACQLGNPLRDHTNAISAGRIGQWDVAAGLALREVN